MYRRLAITIRVNWENGWQARAAAFAALLSAYAFASGAVGALAAGWVRPARVAALCSSIIVWPAYLAILYVGIAGTHTHVTCDLLVTHIGWEMLDARAPHCWFASLNVLAVAAFVWQRPRVRPHSDGPSRSSHRPGRASW